MNPRTKFGPKARNFFYEANNIPGKINKKSNRDARRETKGEEIESQRSQRPRGGEKMH